MIWYDLTVSYAVDWVEKSRVVAATLAPNNDHMARIQISADQSMGHAKVSKTLESTQV